VRLAEYVAAPADIPQHVLERARLTMLDTLGCMVGAVGTPTGERILTMTRQRAGTGRTTTVGLSGKYRAEDSALANGTLAHLLEFDDGHRPSDNHLGCVVVPTALVMAQETGASLADCLAAIVIGYDVMGRVGEATLLPRNSSYFHGTGTTGVFGAAAVTARMLGLDAAQTAQALAVAGTGAAGPKETLTTGPEAKPLHAGRAAMNGITATYLAALGYTGPLTIFEGKHGFCASMCGKPRPEIILDGLGERYSLLESGFKVHSTCGMLFNVLDGVIANRARYGLDRELPETIRIGAPSWLLEDPPFTRRRPKTGGEARFSIPYAVAAAIVDGEVSLRQMTPQRLADARIAAVEERVVVGPDEEVERIFVATREDAFFYYPASIEFDTATEHVRTLHTSPRGYDPTNPLTPDEVVAKFRATVREQLDETATSQLIDSVLNGPADAGVEAIMEPLAGWSA
jgi:2-methylcitrate dehydratase PrpD